MEQISYKVAQFEGPLDLMLHLISKNKLDIYDIKISVILDQYLEHISLMSELDMDVSSEFLEMAARLVYIKTISLLPKHDEVEALKKELTGQLIEYQECKRIAQLMSDKLSFDMFSRSEEVVEFTTEYNIKHELSLLIDAYKVAVGRKNIKKIPISKDSFSGIVSVQMVSVTSKVVFVLRKLWNNQEVRYLDIFEGNDSKSANIATFLAILELTKSKRIMIIGEAQDLRLKLVKREKKNG